MTHFFDQTFRKAAVDGPDSRPVGAASATQRFYLKIGFVDEHRHSAVRESIFALRPRVSVKPII